MEDYKEKYEKAVQRAKEILEHCRRPEYDEILPYAEADLTSIFPELKESEDEKIKEEIIEYLKLFGKGKEDYFQPTVDRWIAWLEKQKTSDKALQYLKENHSPSEVSDFQAAMNIAVAKAYDKGYNDGLEKQGENFPILSNSSNIGKDEQKPAWSEEDEAKLKSILFHIEDVENKDVIDWFKSLKGRVQPQPKQEWSEEDKRKIDRIYSILRQAADTHAYSTSCRLIGDKECIELQDFLKSLRPQNRWKPDKTTLDTLQLIIYHPYSMSDYQQEILINLLEELKKLREE